MSVTAVTGAQYAAYDATLDRLIAISIDRVRREICAAAGLAAYIPVGRRECWPYSDQALAQIEIILRERRVPYVVRRPEFIALHIYTLVVWEPAGLKVVEVYYDNRGFLRDPRGREVSVRGLDSAARYRLAQLDLYACLGLVMERPDRVDVECIEPPHEAARAMWALERARHCIAGAQELAHLSEIIRKYETEVDACKKQLEELRRVASAGTLAPAGR